MDKIQSDKGSSPLYAEGYRRVQSQLEANKAGNQCVLKVEYCKRYFGQGELSS